MASLLSAQNFLTDHNTADVRPDPTAAEAGDSMQGLRLTRVRGLLKSGTSESGNEYHLN
jgi:hypothetical protein